MSKYREHKIAGTMVGSTGNPGDVYSAIWLGCAYYPETKKFEVRAKWGKGSNQGYLEEHDEKTTRARSESLGESLAKVQDIVLGWNVSVYGCNDSDIKSEFAELAIQVEDYREG